MAKQHIKKVLQALKFPTPLPDPPGYVPPPTFISLPAAKKKAKFLKTWEEYVQGFRNEFSPVEESDEDKEAWKETVKEQSSAARNVFDEAQQSPETAKAYFAEWIAIYRETLKGFTNGYKEGQAGIPLPKEAQMKVSTPFHHDAPSASQPTTPSNRGGQKGNEAGFGDEQDAAGGLHDKGTGDTDASAASFAGKGKGSPTFAADLGSLKAADKARPSTPPATATPAAAETATQPPGSPDDASSSIDAESCKARNQPAEERGGSRID